MGWVHSFNLCCGWQVNWERVCQSWRGNCVRRMRRSWGWRVKWPSGSRDIWRRANFVKPPSTRPVYQSQYTTAVTAYNRITNLQLTMLIKQANNWNVIFFECYRSLTKDLFRAEDLLKSLNRLRKWSILLK